MKNEYYFPAVFVREENGIAIEFPDLPGCLPCAQTMTEAFRNAREALGLHLYGMEEDRETIPEPSDPAALTVPDGGVVCMVDVFMPVFRENVRRSTVKKTLTIPYWLNAQAEAKGINFSQVLQDALKARLDLR